MTLANKILNKMPLIIREKISVPKMPQCLELTFL